MQAKENKKKHKRQRGGNPRGCTHTRTHTQLNLTNKANKKEIKKATYLVMKQIMYEMGSFCVQKI